MPRANGAARQEGGSNSNKENIHPSKITVPLKLKVRPDHKDSNIAKPLARPRPTNGKAPKAHKTKYNTRITRKLKHDDYESVREMEGRKRTTALYSGKRGNGGSTSDADTR